MKLQDTFLGQNKGLAFKLILLIFTSTAIIFSITFLYNYSISRKMVEKNLRLNAENLTNAAVLRVDKVLSTVQKIPDNYSKIIEASVYSRDEYINVLKQLVENNPEIFGAGLMFEPYYPDPSLKYNALYVYHKDEKIEFKTFGENVDYFTMDYYQIPKELNRSLWSQPYFDEGVGDALMTTYSVPLYKYINGRKKLIGVLGVDLSLDWLQKYLNSIKIYETGYAFLISSTGTLVSHPDKNVIMNETIFSIADAQKSQQLRTIGYNMIHGGTSFAEMEYHNLRTGKLSWIAYAPVPTNNWSIGVVFPVDELMADVNKLITNLLFIGIGGLAIILMLIILISKSITRPLSILTQAAGRFAQGNFDVLLPQIKSGDEIGKLNSSFIYMQNTLASTINDLREASSKLKISNDKLEEYNRTLEQKVDERTAALNEKNKQLDAAFNDLKAAQAQLVQSEKMASLGQLTAGIAHEIKNPLNFINNYSEITVDLIKEMTEEMDRLSGKLLPDERTFFQEITNDIASSARKINDHGKRADSIIKGMLLHSRGKTGDKQLTDVNALLTEAFNLSYHSIRAQDSNFNIKIETDYDTTIGMINIVAQDINRVFLNIINNACYSTNQKNKRFMDNYYTPVLQIRTNNSGDNVEIRIRDNGTGIPQEIIDKVFNPFFTTKPAGQGTGLGLSLSFDIIVQEHHGEMKVDSKEGEYAEFVIVIPKNLV
jgi:signal transduction histidine kinase